MRIIAGSHRGARIFAPKGTETRPTGDRVREAAFNLLGPGAAEGATVLDLFAGSGAMELEALSRGAEHATFVESERDAWRGRHESTRGLVRPVDHESKRLAIVVVGRPDPLGLTHGASAHGIGERAPRVGPDSDDDLHGGAC